MPEKLQKLLQKPIVISLNQADFVATSALLPSTIEEATKGTPIYMLELAVEPKRIEAFIAVELHKLMSMVNVDNRLNLQPHQIPQIAEYLHSTFRNENLADFVICFKRGSMGRYDEKLLRLDGAAIGQWMYKYLDEKYEVIEDKLMKEKDTNPYEPRQYKQTREDGSVFDLNEFLEDWKKKIYPDHGKKKTDNSEVNEYEREKLKVPVYTIDDAVKRAMHLEWIKSNFDSSGKPIKGVWMDENQWLENNQELNEKVKEGILK